MPNVVTLDDTVDTTTRSQLVDDIKTELIADFAKIRSSVSDGRYRSVDLETIFNAASVQHKPRRTHERTQQTNIAGLGSHDDEDEYLIFNRNLGDDFIRTQKDTICQLFEHEENGDETVHFLLYNSDYDYFSEDGDDVPEIVCNGGSFIPDIKRDTFINFAELIEDDLTFNTDRLEVIYGITCPASVDASGDLGDGNEMELGNHDQFIEALTIVACSLIDNDEHPDTPDLTDDSYILVKDIIGDDNTFEKDGYLLITNEELSKLMLSHPECCDLPPLHIKSIEDDDDLNDDPGFVQRKLFVEVPRSATEYIIRAKLDGNVPAPNQNTLCPSDPGVDGEDDPNPQVLQYIHEILAGLATDDDSFEVESDSDDSAELARRLFTTDFSLIGGPKRWGNSYNYQDSWGGMTASVDYGYDFGFDVRLYIHFDWNLWPWGYIDLNFKIYGYLEANAWFHLHIKFQWTKTFKLLGWSHTFSPRIAGVAIVIRPFFVLQARFETIPFIISAGIDCGYRREWAVGYYVKTDSWFSNFRHGRIESSRTTKNGCEKYYEIGEEGNQMATTCDPYDLGFDLYIEPIVGVTLYEIVAAWIRLELKIPFRIQIPETDSSICSYNKYDCNGTPLKASFKLEPFALSLHFGVELDISVWRIIDVIQALGSGHIFGRLEVSDYTGWQIGGPWYLTGTITLACIELDWLFPGNWVENYIEARCCASPPACSSGYAESITGNNWAYIGRLKDFDSLYRNTYSDLDYEFGVRYNSALGSIHRVTINNWNHGTRISSIDDYPMGDDASSVKFGRVVFTKGLPGNPTSNYWFQYYFYNVNDQHLWSNGVADCVELYARRINSWMYVGVLSSIESLVNTYPQSQYQYGIHYNGAIHIITTNSWNVGKRVSTVYEYPMGDSSTQLRFGKTILTKGLYGNSNGNDWYHYYYYMENDAYLGWNNGVRNDVAIYVRRYQNSLQWIGSLRDYSSLVPNSYNPKQYDFGITYNSALHSIHKIIINSWNYGTRLSTIEDYPMGDYATSLKFGRAVFTYGLSEDPTTNNWYHHYYYLTGGDHLWSNGNADGVGLYAQQKNLWIERGTLSNIESLISTYPPKQYRYGVIYNSWNMVHEVTINSWNLGIRVSTIHSYPMGDWAKSMNFGKVVFTKGLRGSPTSTDWYQYYFYTDNDQHLWSNGNANGVRVFVRAFSGDASATSPIREFFNNNKNVLIGGIAMILTSLLIIMYIKCVGCGKNKKHSMKYKTVDVDSSDIDSSDIEYGSEIPLNDE